MKHLTELPDPLKNPDLLIEALSGKDSLSFEVPRALVDGYNEEFSRIQKALRPRAAHAFQFTTTVWLFFFIRLAVLVAAFHGSSITTVVSLSAFQFVIAPTSLFTSFTLLLALAPPLFLGHVLVYGLLGYLIPFPAITITNEFILWFLVADQLLCLICSIRTPVGKTRWDGWKNLWVHIVWGFLNCKTYTLIVLLCCRGSKVNVLVWLIDAIFKLSSRAALWFNHNLMHWGLLFYQQHRMAHLPSVYNEAHKFHHYIHDSSAFDAHIYGSGAPEDWCAIIFEICIGAVFRITPPSLGYHFLMQSWANKVGHTRKFETGGGSNHHADHHTIHRKNFGIYNPVLDMLFESNHPSNTEYPFGAYMIHRIQDKEMVHIKFVPNLTGMSKAEVEKMLKTYHDTTIMGILKFLCSFMLK